MRTWTCVIAAGLGTIAYGSAGIIRAQSSALEVLRVRPNFYMIVGAGANIGAQVGPDGVTLVNAGTAEASTDVIAAIQKLSDQPIRYVLSTSADLDVVGGNAKVSRAGRNTSADPRGTVRGREPITGSDADAARIIAHESVLTRMSAPTPGRTSPYPGDTWPTESFDEQRWYMYFNDEGIEILHQPAAHTDSDSIVFFRKSDVVVAGNVLDATRFPVIDVARGGSVQGEIDALNGLIRLAIPPGPYVGTPGGANNTSLQPGGTEVLPGHGRVYRQIDLVDYRDMVVIVRDVIQDMINRKMTLDQIKAARPALTYEPEFGAAGATNDFVEAIYKSLTKTK